MPIQRWWSLTLRRRWFQEESLYKWIKITCTISKTLSNSQLTIKLGQKYSYLKWMIVSQFCNMNKVVQFPISQCHTKGSNKKKVRQNWHLTYGHTVIVITSRSLGSLFSFLSWFLPNYHKCFKDIATGHCFEIFLEYVFRNPIIHYSYKQVSKINFFYFFIAFASLNFDWSSNKSV